MHKRIRLTFAAILGRPLALAVAAGMGVSVMVAGAFAQPAVAAPPSTAVAPLPSAAVSLSSGLAALSTGATGGPGIRPRRLKAALLTSADLPAGYQRVGKPTVLKGNLLALAGTETHPDRAGCSVVIDLDKLLDPTKPAPALPRGHTVVVTLSKGDAGPMVSEILGAGDPAAARALVANVVDGVRRCPKVTIALSGGDEKIVVVQSPLPMSSLGDASAAATLSVTINGSSPPVVVKMIAIAKGPVAGLVMLTGSERDLDGFPAIVRAAVRKLAPLSN